MNDVASQGQLWFRRYAPADGAAVRLVCFPHAGGSASYFMPVAQALAPSVDVLAVQYPGRQDRLREPCVDSVHELARLSALALQDTDDRPVALFGHSLGALVAYEVARSLTGTRAGSPVHLFVSGRRAPSSHRDESLHRMGDDAIIAEVRALGGTSQQILADPELRDMVLPALRGDYKAVETYRHVPGAPVRCPVTALTGDRDPKTTVDEAAAWEAHAPADAFELLVFGGGHFFLNSRADEVIASLRERLSAFNAASLSAAAECQLVAVSLDLRARRCCDLPRLFGGRICLARSW
jgi:pyochelin biosynthesis protein PchC